jgi:outer membrane protein OmpA-like peptidoglycan-associated protein
MTHQMQNASWPLHGEGEAVSHLWGVPQEVNVMAEHNTDLSRRSLLALSGAALLITPVPAMAQGAIDREKTRLLRDGLRPSSNSTGIAPPRRRPVTLTPRQVDGFQAERPYRLDLDQSRARDIPIFFAHDSDGLSELAVAELRILGQLLAGDLRGFSYLIAGHTNSIGGFEYNVELSMRRAIAVRTHLIIAHGADPARLYVAGFGPTALKNPRAPASGINRRVEVALVTSVSPR